ncbi:2,6-dihydropseudooxynicotine hydrolase [Xylariomycetidae sp. FL2044]|nr:2,6-dihydropseudooxynicotine hydrolase [Xylariomycetidae sp. FL2044]
MKSTTLLLLSAPWLSLGLASPFRKLKHTRRDNSTSTSSMLQLSTDPDFHYEMLRVLAAAPYRGGDIDEVLTTINNIIPGDFESYYENFYARATRVHDDAKSIDANLHPVSARDAYFRASTYYRSADFYLRSDLNDSRIYTLWDQQRAAFDAANALMSIPGERVTVQADGFEVPMIFYSSGSGPRPTVIMCSGLDGSQEEMYHEFGAAALERGINVITFEGPGQPSVRRDQQLGFIPDWERVVTPVVDYALTRPSEIRGDQIGLLGASFGGYLAPRAAAFEHRLAAVMAVDGIWDFGQTVLDDFGSDFTALWRAGNRTYFDAVIRAYAADPANPTSGRWAIMQGLWAFDTDSPFDWVTQVQAYGLTSELAANITAPVLVGAAESDMFESGGSGNNGTGTKTQAQQLADHLGDRATYVLFENADGAGEHCSMGAAVFSNHVIWDWFEEILGSKGN